MERVGAAPTRGKRGLGHIKSNNRGHKKNLYFGFFIKEVHFDRSFIYKVRC